MSSNKYGSDFCKEKLLPGIESLKQEQEVQKHYSNMLFQNQEKRHLHNSYVNEMREMFSIESGNIEMLTKCWDEVQPASYGKMSENRIRNVKNLCIIIVAFASRAAIRGGVYPEIAFSLCDSYVQKIENSEDPNVLAQLAHRAEIRYTELVNEVKNRKSALEDTSFSPHVEKCKKYIFSHLHDKLTVSEIAAAIHLNPNYLSGLFRRLEGETLLQFILREKIKLSQNMLIYSDYTYSEIANYLGFSSQSQLGVHFKKITSLTLGEYRAKYKSDFFLQKDTE